MQVLSLTTVSFTVYRIITFMENMQPNKSLILLTLMLGTFMASIDSSIVNVSLPVIAEHFQASVDDIQWVVTAYMIMFTLLLPLTNFLKNRVGYYHLLLGCIAVFTMGSLLCSVAPSLPFLIGARVIQAIGGSIIAPVSLAILTETYPPEKRGSAIGWWGIGNIMGPAIGPTLGGALTHYIGWQSIFYVNLPVGIITIILIVKTMGFLKKDKVGQIKLDWQGYIWFTIFLLCLQYSLTLFGERPPITVKSVTVFLVAAACFIFYLRSSRKPNPLIDLTVFKSAVFVNSSVIIMIRSLALYGGMFFIPFLFQGYLGYSELQSGLLLLPNALFMLVSRPLAGKLADKGYIRYSSVTGIVLIGASMFLLGLIDVGTSVYFIIFTMAVRGLGMSLLIAPVSTSLLNAVSINQNATATSLNSLLQQVGGSVGIAISGIIYQWMLQFYDGKNLSPLLAQHHSIRDGFIISGTLILMALWFAMKLPTRKLVFTRAKEEDTRVGH